MALLKRYSDEQEWLNFRAAQICSVMAAALTGKEFTPEDFMPQKQTESNIQTPDEMAAKLRVINMMLGGTFEDKRHGK